MRAVYAASDRGALPAGVGFSMRSSGILDGLPSVGLPISGEQGGGCPMSDRWRSNGSSGSRSSSSTSGVQTAERFFEIEI